jgi:hypothetical protein
MTREECDRLRKQAVDDNRKLSDLCRLILTGKETSLENDKKRSSVSFTAAEHAKLEEEARQRGVSLSEVVREKVAQAVRSGPVTPEDVIPPRTIRQRYDDFMEERKTCFPDRTLVAVDGKMLSWDELSPLSLWMAFRAYELLPRNLLEPAGLGGEARNEAWRQRMAVIEEAGATCTNSRGAPLPLLPENRLPEEFPTDREWVDAATPDTGADCPFQDYWNRRLEEVSRLLYGRDFAAVPDPSPVAAFLETRVRESIP